MAGDTQITVVGNIAGDVELRFTPSGAAVANFTVASTPRKFDKTTSEWVDQQAMFLRCSVWRQAAENVAESLTKGARVIVTGRLKARSYETAEGEKRTVFEIDVDEVGPSLQWATAKITKAARSGGERVPNGPAVDDPWAAPAKSGGNAAGAPATDPWGAPAGQDDSPPF